MESNGVAAHAEAAPVIVRADGEALRSHWKWLCAGLETVKAKALASQRKQGLTRSYTVWLPAHIRVAIIKGLMGQSTVELYLVNSRGRDADGFFITSCPFDEFIQVQLTLFLWIAYSEKAGLLEKCEPFLDKLAEDRGVLAIEHVSGRMAWGRRMQTCGNGRRWRLSQLIWRKEL
jgi:hypothetical protein